jgi:hypothetical protein
MRYNPVCSEDRPSNWSILCGPHHRLLQGIVGIEGRAEHAVAMSDECGPVGFELRDVEHRPDPN